MFLLFGVDPLLDFANAPRVISSLEEANFVVGFSAFESSSLLDCCDLVLPIAAYAENEGSFIKTLRKFEKLFGKIGKKTIIFKIIRKLFHRNLFITLNEKIKIRKYIRLLKS